METLVSTKVITGLREVPVSSVSPHAFEFSTFQTTRTINQKDMCYKSAFCVYFWRKCVFLYLMSLSTLLNQASESWRHCNADRPFRADNNWTPDFPPFLYAWVLIFIFTSSQISCVRFSICLWVDVLDEAKTGLIFHLASCGPGSFLWSTHHLYSITHWPPPSLSHCAHPYPLT